LLENQEYSKSQYKYKVLLLGNSKQEKSDFMNFFIAQCNPNRQSRVDNEESSVITIDDDSK